MNYIMVEIYIINFSLNFSRRYENEIQFESTARRNYTMARRHEDGCQVTGRGTARISEKGEQFISTKSLYKKKAFLKALQKNLKYLLLQK